MGLESLQRARMQWRRWWHRQIRDNVVPLPRHLIFREECLRVILGLRYPVRFQGCTVDADNILSI